MKFINYCGILLIGAVIFIAAAPNSESSKVATDCNDYEYINENFDNEGDELVFGNEPDNDVEVGSSETDGSHEEHGIEDEVNPNWSAEDCEVLCRIETMKIYPKCDKWCKQMI